MRTVEYEYMAIFRSFYHEWKYRRVAKPSHASFKPLSVLFWPRLRADTEFWEWATRFYYNSTPLLVLTRPNFIKDFLLLSLSAGIHIAPVLYTHWTFHLLLTFFPFHGRNSKLPFHTWKKETWRCSRSIIIAGNPFPLCLPTFHSCVFHLWEL